MGHPASCNDPDCTLSYRDHLTGIVVSAAALPTRGKGSEVLSTKVREKRWERDIPAYTRLRKEGLTPPQIDGSALRERIGEDKYDMEHRPVTVDYSDPA